MSEFAQSEKQLVILIKFSCMPTERFAAMMVSIYMAPEVGHVFHTVTQHVLQIMKILHINASIKSKNLRVLADIHKAKPPCIPLNLFQSFLQLEVLSLELRHFFFSMCQLL